ncbi:DEDD exonuclease domain-containing protein [Tessaracoccus caeni]|uniref:DEDD exonuclease domain-containing protein n=1 Tax=Tessaracoccus caeni TaxID=3031239 RepID=UPI0023DA5EE7|nr:DEDD exonuclease domain-containing protein [Tessaracoccus caeni]MDF1486841.1 DEDD exonuclease domain-containing protein [Tessaracoccus caeni]
MTAHSAGLQPSFDDLGTPLHEVRFVVVDLETTGSSTESSITEIGAVKVQGGEILGEFQTLVRPDSPIPAMIQVMTGITNQMVAGAPRIEQVLPSFATFAAGCVLVAHNARFDVGFLTRAFAEVGLAWPRPQVVDTVALARCALLRDEVRNCKLATLAAHFQATTVPNHRALSDARATVDVLHGLLERVGNLGVSTLEDLTEFTAKVSPDRRAKRTWATGLPEKAGVYYFVHESADPHKPKTEVLYVGKSKCLRRRVRSYFTAAETRPRIHEMVRVATGVRYVECATELEADVRELRMIAAWAPRYNRKSKNQRGLSWLKLTDEPFPRLSIVRQVKGDATVFGPFRGAGAAREAAATLYDAFALRQCTGRLSARTASPACALAELGRCSAPCQLGDAARDYPQVVARLRDAWDQDVRPVLRGSAERLAKLVAQQRYEEAGEIAARIQSYYRTSLRYHRFRSIARCPQLVAAAPGAAGWDIHVIRFGKLAAATTAPSSRVLDAAADAIATAETVPQPPAGLPAGSVEECGKIAAWLELPGIRLLETDGDWSWPVGAGLRPEDLARELLGDQATVTEVMTTGSSGRS